MQNSTANKLSHHEQLLIKQWLAEDWSSTEILIRLKDQFNKVISQPTLSYYSHHYKAEIQSIREKINSDVLNIPISNKEVRQRRREDIYRRYLTKGDLEKCREVLKEAQAEMEIKTPLIHMQQNNTSASVTIPQEKVEEIDNALRAIIERSNTAIVRPVEPALSSN